MTSSSNEFRRPLTTVERYDEAQRCCARDSQIDGSQNKE